MPWSQMDEITHMRLYVASLELAALDLIELGGGFLALMEVSMKIRSARKSLRELEHRNKSIEAFGEVIDKGHNADGS